MHTKSCFARKSAPAVVSAPASLDVAANVVTLKPDTAVADVRGLAERSKVWEALENATGTLRTLMVDGLKATAAHGLTSAEELAKYWPTCNNPGVYAPNFNRGHKAAQVLGLKATVDLIDKAAKLPGGAAFDKAKDALSAVMAAGKKRGADAPIATGKEAKAIVDEAVSNAAALLAKRAAKAGAKSDKSPTTPTADTLAAAYADLLPVVARMAKCDVPKGREATHAVAMNYLRLACENMGLCFDKA